MMGGANQSRLPTDFDIEQYLELNPDIKKAGVDPVRHYLDHGREEGRQYSLVVTPRRPQKAKPMFFLHIPKTAGSSMNLFCSKRMSFTTHIEDRQEIKERIRQGIDDYDFASGHLYLPEVLTIISARKWFKFTFLREPIQQTVSHLKWVKSLGTQQRKTEAMGYRDSLRDLFDKLQEISLDDIDAIGDLVESHYEARNLFDNCQTRYLISPKEPPVDCRDFTAALLSLREFDYVAFCESATQDSAEILRLAGWGNQSSEFPHTNSSPLEGQPNFADPAILAFYRNLASFDIRLYTYALREKASRLQRWRKTLSALIPGAVR
ncbi:sulfotransferase family 2 domain-containing protein (plasmid) [Rhizobium sp. CB3171]|uniref:sulfotransferase family 2 domain-containing protein n=1 Tax=Rhizobium sp. CB3171 TaxID=3039157 RepID=UPI0024B1E93E|nr:sulfotransferase family 2 domain-containing protein [Rhizobium sp. CB3171]WFU05950.1 sulfotransferase family 2 domain-containing protein [Rhizobium sp. CB3171]